MNISLNQLKDPAFDLSEAGGGVGLNNGPGGEPAAAMDPEQQQQVCVLITPPPTHTLRLFRSKQAAYYFVLSSHLKP